MMDDVRVHGDWGSTRLRLFLMRGDQVIDRWTGPGVGTLSRPAAEVLREAVAPWRAAHPIDAILLCGMAGSRNGVAETLYAECPADAARWSAGLTTLDLNGVALAIAPGLACVNAIGAPDVMRGEETQIFGALETAPRLARGRRLIVLPGTHSKWAVVQDGCVLGFQTYLTGELFGLLRDHSSLTRADSRPEGEAEGYRAGLARADTADLLGALFEARSAQLRQGRLGGWARGFLSGLLIGAEVHAAVRRHGTAEAIAIIAEPGLAASYGTALDVLGCRYMTLDGNECALAGLATLEAGWRGTKAA